MQRSVCFQRFKDGPAWPMADEVRKVLLQFKGRGFKMMFSPVHLSVGHQHQVYLQWRWRRRSEGEFFRERTGA